METQRGPTGSTPPFLKSESSSPTNSDENGVREAAASDAAGLRQDDMEAESSNTTATPMMDTDDAKITPSLAAAAAAGIGSQSGGSSGILAVDADTGTPGLCSTEKETQRVAENGASIVEEEAKPPAPKRRTDPRSRNNHQCGSCDACMIDDCGECENCRINPRFGGRAKKKRRCLDRPKCLDPPEAKKKTTPSEVSSLIDGSSLLTVSRLRPSRKRGAPTAAAADAGAYTTAAASSSSSSIPVRSSARNRARSKQQQEKQDAKSEQIRIKSTRISSRGATEATKKSGESTTSNRTEKTRTSNKAVEKDGWTCGRCDNLNAPEKQRCSACLRWAWKNKKQGTHCASPTSTNTTTTTIAAATVAVNSSRKKQNNPNTVTVTAIVGGERVPKPEDKVAKLPARRSTAKPKSFVEPVSVELDPLDEADALPDFPSTGRCEWSFDDTSRVLLAKFSFDCSDIMHPADQQFLLEMMERDDVTVINEGLVNDLDPGMWNLQFISGVAGNEYCHKIRRFSRQVVEESKLVAPGDEAEGDTNRHYFTHKEEDGYVSMKLSDYIAYLDKRAAALQQFVGTVRNEDGLLHPDNPKTNNDESIGRQVQEDEVEPSVFTFKGHDGKEYSINVLDEVLYLTDFDLVKHLPALDDDLKDKFKLSGCLPGGRHCMMNGVNINGRPFMGPNFYVTPPASFTHFHQDGHGTVDSGHICLSGFNEVVMLRRMPEQHKKRALYILNGGDKRKGKNRSTYDGLYGLPHEDGLGEKPLWPSHDAIQQCREMNYCPSVFILKPGQLVHINKGRLHAFRKLSPTALPASDCHAALRSELVEKAAILKEQICVSVAWDWLYQGVTSEGINREIVSTLECARLNREHHTQSLAIPETSLLHMARRFVAQHEQEMAVSDAEKRLPLLSFQPSSQHNQAVEKEDVSDGRSSQSPLVMLKGILPSLSYVINRHKMSHDAAQEMKGMKTPEGQVSEGRVSIAARPNAWENPDAVTIDPYSNGDFVCRLCGEELSNCYMHCDGCEELLNKDYNICVSCFSESNHKCFSFMHPFNKRRNTSINHVGNMKFDRKGASCPCANGPKCKSKSCGYCAGCSCRCHTNFTMHLRFMSIEDEVALLKRVEAAVGDDALPPDTTLAKLESEEFRRKDLNQEKKVAATPS